MPLPKSEKKNQYISVWRDKSERPTNMHLKQNCNGLKSFHFHNVSSFIVVLSEIKDQSLNKSLGVWCISGMTNY